MKFKLNAVIVVFLSLALIANGAVIPTYHQSKNKIEDKVFKTIGDLPKVKAFMLKAKKQKPQLLIAQEPVSKEEYYWIKVGLGDNDIFRTMYNFCVDPKTFKVYYLDMMVDDGNISNAKLTLQEWRHWRTNPNFYKMHKYKNGKLVVL